MDQGGYRRDGRTHYGMHATEGRVVIPTAAELAAMRAKWNGFAVRPGPIAAWTLEHSIEMAVGDWEFLRDSFSCLLDAVEALQRACLGYSMGYVYCRLCHREWYEAGGEASRHSGGCVLHPAPKEPTHE